MYVKIPRFLPHLYSFESYYEPVNFLIHKLNNAIQYLTAVTMTDNLLK